MALTVNLNNVQHNPIVVSASLTTALNRYYVNTASATYTDPTPAQGEGFIVFVRNGTATIGGTGYSVAGTIVFRYYHSGSWANYSLVDPTGNFQPLDPDLTSIAALAGTDGYLRKTAANTWELDAVLTKNTDSIGINSNSTSAILTVKEKTASSGTTLLSVLSFGDEPSLNVSENGVTVLQNRSGDLIALLADVAFGTQGADISLTGTTSNLDTSGSSMVILSAIGNQNLTGLLAPTEEGTIKYLYNIDSVDTITLKHNTTSSASNRFSFTTSADVSLPPGNMMSVIYINSRWRNAEKISTGVGDALTSNPLSQFASTTSSELAGVISDETGTGSLVFGTTPTFTTSIIAPLVNGSTSSAGTLSLASTSHATKGVIQIGSTDLVNIGNKTSTSQRVLRVGQGNSWIDIGTYFGDANYMAYYINQATPGNTNYSFLANATYCQFNAPTSGGLLYFSVNGATTMDFDSSRCLMSTLLTFGDGKNMSFNTTTGTKIGTGTTQKLSFWNATPIVQPTTAVAASTFVSNTSLIANDTATFDGYTIGQVVKALRNIGLLA